MRDAWNPGGQFPRRLGLRCLTGLGALALPLAAAPTLSRVEPPGGQRGSAVRLALEGNGLDGRLQVHSAIPGTLTELAAEGPTRQYLLEIAADAAPGTYPLAVETPAGLSNTWLFSVSTFPETAEAESRSARRAARNDSADRAQPLAAPTVVNGTLGKTDRDMYRVDLRAGERIVFEAEARRLGSAIDPVLAVRGPDGLVAARSDDSPGIGSDARILFVASDAGPHWIEIHDARFSAQRRNFYRLLAGPLEFAEAIFPLGWTAGEAVAVELSGGTLDRPREVTVAGDRVAFPSSHPSQPIPFLRGEGPEELEPSRKARRRLTPGTVMNGRIARAGEVDRYRLPVQEGEEWLIETQAAILGTSQLYTLLVAHDQDGKKLGSAGDQPPEELLSNISTRAETFGDPALGLRIPAGITELEVSVEDLLGRGGPGFAYRLVARRQPPDFIVRLDDTQINIPRNGSTSVGVTLDRRGHLGAVRIVAEGLPPGVTAEGGYIPAEFGGMTTQRASLRGRLTLTAEKGAEPARTEVRLYGEGRDEEGRAIRRQVLTSLLATPVAGPGQRPVRVPAPSGGVPATLAASQPASLEVLSPRSLRLIQGLKHDIRWAYHAHEPGVRATSAVRLLNAPAVGNLRVLGAAKIKVGDTEGVFEMNTTMGTPAMRFDLVLQAQVRHAGRDHTVYSPAIVVDIVQGYAVGAPQGPVTARPGEPFTLSGSFSREPEFDSEVVVEAANLPAGTTCQPQTIQGSPRTYALACRAGADAQPGAYRVEVAPRSVLAGRGKEAVPYNIPAVEAALVLTDDVPLASAQASARSDSS